MPGFSERLAQDGDTLRDSLATGTFDKVLQEVRPIKDRLDTLLGHLNQTAIYLNRLLDSRGGPVPEAIGAVRTLSEGIHAELSPTAQRLRQTLQSLDQTLAELRPTLKKTLESVQGVADSTAERLPSLLARLDSSSAQLRLALRALNEAQGTAGLLLRDSSLYRDLDKTAISLRRLLDELRIHPERFVHFSLFGRRPKPPADE